MYRLQRTEETFALEKCPKQSCSTHTEPPYSRSKSICSQVAVGSCPWREKKRLKLHSLPIRFIPVIIYLWSGFHKNVKINALFRCFGHWRPVVENKNGFVIRRSHVQSILGPPASWVSRLRDVVDTFSRASSYYEASWCQHQKVLQC